jgi:NAD-dependent dihydropyrimidine dehydrogenase PreA subunit
MKRAMPDEIQLPEGPDAPGFDRAKARQAAKHPRRPGENCRAEPGQYRPRVDRRRCEGKSDCVAVCPHGVFEVRKIDEHDYQALPALARLKLRVHGKKTAYAPRADACRACGLCVVACPEQAIALVRADEAPEP